MQKQHWLRRFLFLDDSSIEIIRLIFFPLPLKVSGRHANCHLLYELQMAEKECLGILADDFPANTKGNVLVRVCVHMHVTSSSKSTYSICCVQCWMARTWNCISLVGKHCKMKVLCVFVSCSSQTLQWKKSEWALATLFVLHNQLMSHCFSVGV